MVAEGIKVTPSSVSTNSRVLTNWLGNNAKSSLLKMARTFTVPVVVSIWLSRASNLPLRDLRLCSAIVGVDGQLGILAKLGLDRTEAVLRYRENHRDGLYLCDDEPADSQCCSGPPLHQVPRIHQAQTDPAGMGAVIWQ